MFLLLLFLLLCAFSISTSNRWFSCNIFSFFLQIAKKNEENQQLFFSLFQNMKYLSVTFTEFICRTLKKIFFFLFLCLLSAFEILDTTNSSHLKQCVSLFFHLLLFLFFFLQFFNMYCAVPYISMIQMILLHFFLEKKRIYTHHLSLFYSLHWTLFVLCRASSVKWREKNKMLKWRQVMTFASNHRFI